MDEKITKILSDLKLKYIIYLKNDIIYTYKLIIRIEKEIKEKSGSIYLPTNHVFGKTINLYYEFLYMFYIFLFSHYCYLIFKDYSLHFYCLFMIFLFLFLYYNKVVKKLEEVKEYIQNKYEYINCVEQEIKKIKEMDLVCFKNVIYNSFYENKETINFTSEFFENFDEWRLCYIINTSFQKKIEETTTNS